MGRRVAAAWALIGFAGQCFVSIVEGLSLDVGMQRALIAYVVCGIVGFIVGKLVQRAVINVFDNFVQQQETAGVADQPSSEPQNAKPENAAETSAR